MLHSVILVKLLLSFSYLKTVPACSLLFLLKVKRDMSTEVVSKDACINYELSLSIMLILL